MNKLHWPRTCDVYGKLHQGNRLKSIISFLLFTFCMSAFANNVNPFTVKERLRLVLWEEGIQQPVKKNDGKKLILPEEIERPLRKL